MALRLGAWVTLGLSLALLLLNMSEMRPGTTPDSPSYLLTALTYRDTGELVFPPHREPGYRLLLLGLSLAVPWNDVDDLVRWTVGIQATLYLTMAALLAWRLHRLAGPWGAALALLLFAADRFDMNWVFAIQSEAPSKLAMLFALWLVLGKWRWRWPAALLVLGVVPILRPSDLAVPLGALAGTAVWALMRWRDGRALAGLAVAAAALLGPTLAYSTLHGWATGFHGISERSASHLTGRILAVTDPAWLAARGMDKEFLDDVARPLWEANADALHRRITIDDEFGRPSGLSFRYCPFPRREIVALARDHATRLGLASDEYAVSTLLQRQGNRALALLPPDYLACAAEVTWDYVRLPVVRAALSHSHRNKLMLVLPAVFLGSLLLAVRSRHRLGLAMAVTPVAAFPAYLAICGLFNNYMERLATHLWLPMALCALAAAILARSRGLGTADESC